MACRDKYQAKTDNTNNVVHAVEARTTSAKNARRLLFGVDSKSRVDELLQNNLNKFEWVVRNKIVPNFFGRYISGDECLTKSEIEFIHSKGCKIAALFSDESQKLTKEQAVSLVEKIDNCAFQLGVPEGVAIFLEINESETVSYDFLKEFASSLLFAGFTPGFKVNTDAKYVFDREFSRGIQNNRDLFSQCLVWATAPTVEEYNGITTSHLIHPDDWKPYAPSGMSRKNIAVWQYGINCHPIENDNELITTFNLNLVCDEQIIINQMF